MPADHQRELKALVRWITAELARGCSQNDIAQDLITRGSQPEQARAIVSQVAEMREKRGKRTTGQRIKAHALSFAGIVVLFALVNGALYVGQEVYYHDEVEKAEALEEDLDRLDAEITRIDAFLAGKIEESDAIDALGRKLDDPRVHYSSRSAYEDDLRRYNAWVERWNAQLPHLGEAAARRDSLVNEYNTLVERYNTIAAKAYSRWYLLPVPLGSRSRSYRSGI